MKFTLRNDVDKAKAEAQTVSRAATAGETELSELVPNEASRRGIFLFAAIMFCVGAGVVLAITWKWFSLWTVLGAAAVGTLAATCVRVAPHWERVVILRMGQFNRIAGPGFYAIMPFFEYIAIHVDCRTMTSSFSAEAALTADLVPVDVDAILFWMVWDVQKACLEVENYPKAVLRSAQTALRDAIGQQNLADLAVRRKQIDHELQEIMGEKCEQWGIAVLSVEIRDITVPKELQDALSREAQAERERNARVILAEVEKDISEMFVEAADEYDKNPKALQLRAMNLAYEGARDGRGVIFAPSNIADGFDLGKMLKGE